MNWFNNLKISKKILSGFILVALIAAIVGAVGYSGMQKVKVAQDEGATIYLPSVESILIMSKAQTAVDSAENALLNEELTGQARQEQYDRICSSFGFWRRRHGRFMNRFRRLRMKKPPGTNSYLPGAHGPQTTPNLWRCQSNLTLINRQRRILRWSGRLW